MNRDMLMSILDELNGSMDDSIMGDVAKKKPAACITITITGPKGAVDMKNSEPEGDEPTEPEGDELDQRLASVARGRGEK